MEPIFVPPGAFNLPRRVTKKGILKVKKCHVYGRILVFSLSKARNYKDLLGLINWYKKC
jgi:hypothetical protein